MNLFLDAAFITAGIFAVYGGFKILQYSGRAAFIMTRSWVDRENSRRLDEGYANTLRARENATQIEALRIMECNPTVADLVQELGKNPYVHGKSNTQRNKIQAKLRKLVVSRSVRDAMFSIARA